jgi:dihydroflavonol-4-reductase
MPETKNKVMLTGANGLLGSNIAHQLVLQGYEVVTLIRKGSNMAALKGIECKILEGNITNATDVEKAIKECDYVVHCAAKTDQKGSLLEFEPVNITATTILINLSRKYNIRRFVFVSTANCFTNGAIENPGDENSKFMPWLKKSGYAYSKYVAQSIVLTEFKKSGFPAVVVAPTFMIGPRDAKLSSGKLIMHGLKNRFVFYPTGGKSFIDVEYAAEATVNALKMGRDGESYLLAGENLTYRQFFRKVRQLVSPKIILIPIPEILLKIVAVIFSSGQFVFNLPLPFNVTNQRLLCLDNYFSNKKAVTELKLKYTLVDSAIIKAKQWFDKNNML